MSEEKNTQEEKEETKPVEASASKEGDVQPSSGDEQATPDTDQASSGDDEEEVIMPERFQKIVAEIEQMSVLDLHELVQVFEKKFGVSAAAVAVAPATGGADGEDEGGGLVTVKLEDAGATKIQVIKVVKEVLGLGLKEAKDLVDAAPKDLKEGITGEEAEELKGKLEGAGAKVSVA